MNKSTNNTWFAVIIIVAMLFWGGSWTSAKIITTSAASEVLVFWRFLVTFLSFIPLIFIMRIPLRINRTGLLQILAGTFFLVTYNLLFFTGLKTGLAGAGGVIVTTLNPALTFCISAILFRKSIGKKELLGLLLGFAGGMVLIQIWNIGTGKLLDGGNMFFLLAAAVWASLSIVSHQSKDNMSPFAFSFYVYGLSALVDFFIAIPHGVFDMASMSTAFWLNILFLSIGATTFATTAYFFAASQLGANKASSFTFLVPTSAVFFSWIFLGEVPTVPTIIGGIMALAAVYVINRKPKSVVNSSLHRQVENL